MKFEIFCLYDRVAGLYGTPFYQPKVELAVRQFDYVMLNAPMVAKDNDLYCLGTFDSETGVITPCSPTFIKHADIKE